jgi:hypothetical protein
MLHADRQPCHSYFINGPRNNLILLLMTAVLFFLIILMLCSTPQQKDIIVQSSFLIMTAWLFGRYIDTINTWYEVDVFTVYICVWQFFGLIYKWLYQDLPYLSFALCQKAFCLYVAFYTFIMYDILFRYLPKYVNFALIWLVAAVDM